MTETQRLRTDANDAELISRVRGGDVDAYGELFSRHVDAATRLARTLVGSADADDLVSESFVKVLNVLLGGGGPDIAFRAYLLTAVRRLHVDKVRATRRATPTDDLTPYDPGIPFQDTVISGFEGGAAARAFASLPERWQMVLWHLEVEGQKPADVAPLLGMSANSVSALAYRAREGLRQAFLQMHTADLVDDNCRWTHDKIGAYVRKGLSRRDQDKVERHLDECRRCTAIYLELAEVNSSLAAVLGPLVLGGAAGAYLGGATAGAGGLVGVGALFGRARDFIVGNGQAAIAVGAATGVAAAATAGFLVLQHPKEGRLVVSDPGLTAPSLAVPSSPATKSPRHRTTPARHAASDHLRRSPAATPSALTTPVAATTGSSAPQLVVATTSAAPQPGVPTSAASGPDSGPTSGPTSGSTNEPPSQPPPTEPPPTEPPPTEPPPTEPPPTEPPPTEPPPTEPPPTEPPPTEPPSTQPPVVAGLLLVAGVVPNTLVATVTVPGDSATMTVSSQQSLNAYGWSASAVGGDCTDPQGSSAQICTFGRGTGVVTFGYQNPPKSGVVTFTVTPGDVTCTWRPGSRPSCP